MPDEGKAEEESDRGWRSSVAVIAAVFVATRAIVIAIAALVETAIPLASRGPTFSGAPILSTLTASDSLFYLRIAASGYHAEPVAGGYLDWAFFPLYPLVTRVASVITLGDLAVAGVLVSNLAFFAACLALYRLGRRYVGDERALMAVVYVAIAPGAVAFTMAYSDSLFLLLALGACLAAERRTWPAAGLLYGLASLTRLPGALLGVALVILWFRSRPRSPVGLGWLALGPVALLSWSAYLGLTFGDPLGFLHAQIAWNAPAPSVDSGALPGGIVVVGALLVAVESAYVFLLLFFRRDRMPVAYGWWAIAALVAHIFTLRAVSFPRFLAVVWPFGWSLSNRGRVAAMIWPSVSAALFAIFAFLHFTQVLAP